MTLIVGVIGLSFCLNYWLAARHAGEPRRADVPRGLFWGTVSGFTSFVSHAGAPPYQMYVLPQRLEKMVYAGTTTILFAVVNAVKLVPYWALGQLSLANLKTRRVRFCPSPSRRLSRASGWSRIIPQGLFYRLGDRRSCSASL